MPRHAIELGYDLKGAVQTLTPKERSTHLHVMGATGKGKSRFLEAMIRQDLRNGKGLCLIDPHGSLFDDVKAYCTRHALEHRRKIHLIDMTDPYQVVGLDPLRCDDPARLSFVIDGLVAACAQVWGGEDLKQTPLLRKCLRLVFYVLAEQNCPFADAIHLTNATDNDGLRRHLTNRVTNPFVQRLWDDLNSLPPAKFIETFASTNNRLVEFLIDPVLRAMFSQKEHALDLRTCMEEGHVVLVNLKPGYISADNARVIGTIITSTLFQLARQRENADAERQPFYLYIDECYRFLTDDIESMLDETRKSGLHLCLSHQRLAQLGEPGSKMRSAVMTNARSKVLFGGASDEDAEHLAKEVLRETFDFNRPKTLLDKPTVVGYETTALRGVSRGHSGGQVAGQSVSSGRGTGTAIGSSLGQLYDENMTPVGMQNIGDTEIETTSEIFGSGEFSAASTGWSQSESYAEALIPILEWMHTAVEGETEILNRAILQIRKLPQRFYFLSKPDEPPVMVETQEVKTARATPAQIADFTKAVNAASPFSQAVADMDNPDEVDFDPVDDEDLFSVPDNDSRAPGTV